jgi:hypothetical protein
MAWLTGWNYRKSIVVKRASGAVSNYQMKLLLGESSGAVGEQVDCGGKCLSSFNDIMFTKADGTTLLDYWIESISGASPNQLATVWIEFDSIGTGDTTFYVYYGKVGASAVSNGANTFILFDDFEWGADGNNINTSGGSVTWAVLAGACTISTTISVNGTRSLKLAYTTAQCYASLTASINQSIHFKYYKPDAGAESWFFLNGTTTKRMYVQMNTSEDILAWNGSSYVDTALNAIANAWNDFEINNFNATSNTFDLTCNGVKKVNAPVDAGAGISNRIYFSGNSTISGDCFVDVVFVRNWMSTEPIWVSFGSEVPEPTTAPPTTLAPTTLAPTTLIGTTLAPTTLFGVSPRAILVNGKLVNKSILFGRLVQ